MLYANSNYKENGYKVYGRKVSHVQDANCSECKEHKEVATVWNRRRDDFDYSAICKECAVKAGYDLV